MFILSNIVNWIKGDLHVTERVSSTQLFEGIIPASGNYSEEEYRCRVERHCVTSQWDCEWIKPTRSYFCVVNPLSRHAVPSEVRCRTILISEPMNEESYQTDDPEEALRLYLDYIIEQRTKFQRHQ